MCLSTFKRNRHTCRRPRQCYKIVALSKDGTSWKGMYLHNDKSFKFNEILEEKPVDVKYYYHGTTYIGEGFFHYYRDYGKALAIAKSLLSADSPLAHGMRRTKRKSIFDESFTKNDDFLCLAVCPCTIPIGSDYFTNSRGCGASNKIIVHEPTDLIR